MSFLKQILFVLAITGLIIGIVWEINDKGYEPILAILGSMATLIGLYLSKSDESLKPILKDVKLNISKTDLSNNFIFSILTKNFGQKPAEKIKVEWIFFKLNSDGKIESRGKRTTEEDTQYQNTLNPNEEWTYSTTGNLPGGITELRTIITRLEFNYFDTLYKKRISAFYYYGFKIEDGKLKIATLNSKQRDLIEEYMATHS